MTSGEYKTITLAVFAAGRLVKDAIVRRQLTQGLNAKSTLNCVIRHSTSDSYA